MVKVGGIPHPFLLGARQKLASLRRGWSNVPGTNKVLAVLNLPVWLLVTARVPRVTSLMPLGGAAASGSHGGVQRGTKPPLRIHPDGKPKLAAAQGGSGGSLGCLGMLKRSPVMVAALPKAEMVTADAGTSSLGISVVTYRRGDRDQIPPAAPRAPAQHPLSPQANPKGLQ